MRALSSVSNRLIGLLTVLTDCDRGKGLYFHLALCDQRILFAVKFPTLRQIFRHNAADLTDVQRDIFFNSFSAAT